jgi:hypothetical protein
METTYVTVYLKLPDVDIVRKCASKMDSFSFVESIRSKMFSGGCRPSILARAHLSRREIVQQGP